MVLMGPVKAASWMSASLPVMQERLPRGHMFVVRMETLKAARAFQSSAQMDFKFQIRTGVPSTPAMEARKTSVSTHATMVMHHLDRTRAGRTTYLQVVNVFVLIAGQKSLAWTNALLRHVPSRARA